MDATTAPPVPVNEAALAYAPGSPERAALQDALTALEGETHALDACVGGEFRPGGGEEIPVVMPHDHRHTLGVIRAADGADTKQAIDAARQAAPEWQAMSPDDRAAVFLRAADLLAGPWRQRLNAATMLGQSKTAVQAEVDSACELIDFWRFNAHYAAGILAEQPPAQSPGAWNRSDHRPLEGFVYAITPFNFTSIAANLPTAPALLGNVVLWKPAPTQQLAATLTMRLLTEAGLPPGVISMLPGSGTEVSAEALTHPDLAGIHFTGSTRTFRYLWRTVGENIDGYRGYPRLVGETGGKDFILAHSSADRDVLVTALIRGAFEYQGQKCSAASRAYLPRTVWDAVRDRLVDEIEAIAVGDVRDFGNFMGAVIDRRAYAVQAAAIARARATPGLRVLAGGTTDDETGYFVRPTLVLGEDPADEVFTTEYFGPVLAVHVYDDDQFDAVAAGIDAGSAYALTGAVIARDRRAVVRAQQRLRFAAGNFYVNDKPTGAVVGQQPFGGARASGTNDKAGSAENLRRWTTTRSVKETFSPATDYRYPHMA
jgi:1-pyrroline-5-carboxylate dehydrogenase